LKPIDPAFENTCAFARLREIQPMPAGHNFRDRIRRALRLHDVPPLVRRVIVGVIGGTVLLIGIVLMVLPGPAFIVIPLGLAILATEFVWARRWLHKARSLVGMGKNRSKQPPVPSSEPDAG
jgi:tellurite resistance protein TerC